MTDAPTQPSKPVQDSLVEAQTVFAYRGQETHGVPMTGTPDLVDVDDLGDPVVPNDEPTEPDPIPVRIVSGGGREYRHARIQRTYAADDPTQVVGMNNARTGVRIRNLSTTAGDRVWFAEQAHIATNIYGYPLDPGAEVTLSTEEAIFVRRDPASPTNPIPLAVLIEYVVTSH